MSTCRNPFVLVCTGIRLNVCLWSCLCTGTVCACLNWTVCRDVCVCVCVQGPMCICVCLSVSICRDLFIHVLCVSVVPSEYRSVLMSVHILLVCAVHASEHVCSVGACAFQLWGVTVSELWSLPHEPGRVGTDPVSSPSPAHTYTIQCLSF